ncbi:MAG: histidine kinase [Actinomycetota bacterium]|nr:histidine kinase [Actinomycetota bacterium]
MATEPWLFLVWLYGLVGLVPLTWRDRAPLRVFATQCVLTVAAWPIFPYYTPIVGIPVALYAVSAHYSKKNSLAALLVSFIPIGLGAAVAFRVHDNPADQISSFSQNAVFLVLVAVGAWGLGRLTRASQRRVQCLEREKKTAQEAVAEERRRIARELHDSVSHAVTVMILQAAGASEVADSDIAETKQALARIETTGKQAMAELQRLLGVLASNNPTDHAADIDGLGPQPGLADLTALLASFRTTGRQVINHVEGTPRALDPSVDLAAYRIVQEGLTNVLKHAGEHANPQLRLIWEAHSLFIQIDNGTNLAEAHQEQAISGGRGLIGLRERVHAVGGHLDAKPHRGAGYRLTATLPLATPATHPRVPPTTVPRSSSPGRGD